MPNYTILAVDDEQFNLDLIEAAFSKYDNTTIYYAKSGQEALTLLEKVNFNVVLLDISMPKMDGIEVLKRIKANISLHALPVLMVTANVEKEAEALKLGASDFIYKPYEVEILCTRTLNYAQLNQYTKKIENHNHELEEKVTLRTQELRSALEFSREAEFEISTRLGRACESRDPETGGHIKRMSHYSELLAKLYGLSVEDVQLILYASPLHDIGKIGIPDNILLKPGKFEAHEFDIIKTHSEIGAYMLEGAERFPVLKAGKIIALEHHEKWDGSGYPKGLKGEEIHLFARIVAIADVFDALSSKRCYKEVMPVDKVLNIIEESSGTHFDPQLTQIFLDNIDKFLEIKDIYKDEHCKYFNRVKDVKNEITKKIALIDNGELNRILITEMLYVSFPNVYVASFVDILDLEEENLEQYDLILSDVNILDIQNNKIDILRKKYHYTKPIIAVTGLDAVQYKEQILANGFEEFVAKPINIIELTNSIKQYI